LRHLSRRVVRVEIGQKPGVVRGTGSSNPSPSSGESANFRFPSGPFWLIRVDAPKTREGLAHIAAVRREEVVRFIEGISIFALPTATGCAVCIACRPLAAGLALHRGR
jgi:hypothetical protein